MAFKRKLCDSEIRSIKRKEKAFKKADGGGLYLWVPPSGSCAWRYKYRIRGVEKTYTIGLYPDISLSKARELHEEARAHVALEQDPVEKRRDEDAKIREERQLANKGNFEGVAHHWLQVTSPSLRPATLLQRERELNRYVFPAFNNRFIESITRNEIFSFLKSIKAIEVARNVRTHMYNIFESAIDAGLIQANPIPSRKIFGKRKQKNHLALPLEEFHNFIKSVKNSDIDRSTIIAMRLVVLTLLRKHEVINATWDEINLSAREWIIPAERMKKDREHWVPLTDQAVELLQELRQRSQGHLLFPNIRDSGRPMSQGTLNAVIYRLGYKGKATIHGFRSMASTYLNESKRYHADVIERALAHGDENKIRDVYNKAQYRQDRAIMLQEWANYLTHLENKPTRRRRHTTGSEQDSITP